MKSLLKSSAILIIIFLLFCSCSSDVGTFASKPVPSVLPERNIIYDAEGNLDYELMWPEKKTLILAYSDVSEVIHYLNQLVFAEKDRKPYPFEISDSLIVLYNDYLFSQGKGYVVKFLNEMNIIDRITKDYQSLGDDSFRKSVFRVNDVCKYFYDLIREMKEEGQQIDIIFTGTRVSYSVTDIKNGILIEESGISLENPGEYAIKDGLLMDISDYVTDRKDMRLYDSLPSEYWGLFIDYDGIFGLYNNGLIENLNINIDKKIIIDYGIDQTEMLIEEIDTLYKNLYQDFSEKITEQRLMLIDNRLPSYIYQKLAGIFTDGKNQYLSYKYDSNGEAFCINRFTDPEYIHLNEMLADWAIKQYFNGSENKEEGGFQISRSPKVQKHMQYLTFFTVDNFSSARSEPDYIQIKASPYTLIGNRSYLVGIASWSLNPDEAYDFLSTLFTDPYLSNLMYYGENYDKNDNVINLQGIYQRAILTCKHLMYPSGVSISDRENISVIIENIDIPPNYAFKPDLNGMEYDFSEIDRLCKEGDDLWRIDPSGFKENISEIAYKLKELGYDRLINEINRQLKEYWKEVGMK